MKQLAPSVLSADFARLGEEVRNVSEAGAPIIHLDIMDGAFVPPITFGADVVKAIRPYSDKVFDVHMMVEEPGRLVEDFAKAGADIITVHAEACRHLDRTVRSIQALGLKAGVAINPATPLSALEYMIGTADMFLLMTVNPGFGGQSFVPYMTGKIREMRRILDERGLDTPIEIDGGVSLKNAKELALAGADILVAGSAVFRGDAAENVRAFHAIFREI